MKLTDILTEAINLSRYHNEFSELIHKTLQKMIDDDQYQVYTSDDYYKNGKKRQTKRSKFSLDPNKVAQSLAQSLQYKCMEIIRTMSKSRSVNDFRLRFDHISTSGTCEGIKITIDIEEILTPIIDSLNISKDAWSVDVSPLISILSHELTHAIQNIKAWDNLFFNGSSTTLGTRSKEDRMVYYSHPREMPAFAHNFAATIISNHLKTSTPPDLTDIPMIVKNHLKNVFSDEDWRDPKNFKILKKYYTLIYKEVVDYMEYKEKKKSIPNKLVPTPNSLP